MSGGGGTTRTEQNSGPPDFQVVYLKDIFARAKSLYNNGDPLIAGFTPEEISGQQRLTDYARSGAQDLANTALGAGKFALGDVLNPESNRYLRASADAATRGITEDFSERILPQIRSEGTLAGQYGGSRQGISEGLAGKEAIQQVGDVRSKMYSDAYNRGLQTFETGLALSPQLMELGARPAQWEAGVGAQKRAMEQAKLMEPYLALQEYLSFVGGNYGGEGETTSTSPETFWQRIGLGSVF